MNTTGEMRKITVVYENQILLKHHGSAWGLSAGSGSGQSYPWNFLWRKVIPDKCQLALVGFWFVVFLGFFPPTNDVQLSPDQSSLIHVQISPGLSGPGLGLPLYPGKGDQVKRRQVHVQV